MARYFFHLNYADAEPGAIGVELASPERARAEATRFLGELLVSEGERVWGVQAANVTVVDEGGLALCSIDVRLSGSPAAASVATRRA